MIKVHTEQGYKHHFANESEVIQWLEYRVSIGEAKRTAALVGSRLGMPRSDKLVNLLEQLKAQ